MNNDIIKNGRVTLNIPAAAPIKTLDGNLHEAGQVYKVLGWFNAQMVRLSRRGDNAKLIIETSRVTATRIIA